jgi:hypothetical protein
MRGRAPANKGLRYPADPPAVEESIAVMRVAGEGADGDGLLANGADARHSPHGNARRFT